MKKTEKEEQMDFTLDADALKEQIEETSTPIIQKPIPETPVRKMREMDYGEEPLVNCLREETIEVRFIPQPGTISDPKHVMYGGMSENAKVTICVPKLRSGTYVDVLTRAEKNYLEYVMGLDKGAMNVYNKVDNFWSTNSENGISKVILNKRDNRLDLSDPVQYIQYKILLANKDIIAPDLYTLQDRPKATYRFVLVASNELNSVAKTKMNIKKQCYMEFGKIEDNTDILRAVIEIMTSKPLAVNTKLDFLQTKAGELIDADAKMFLSIVKDPLLPTRVLIKKCVEQGFISRKGDYYYLRSDNTPLCEGGEEPTMNVAAKYLSNPKRQTIKLSLEAKLK